MIPNTHDKCIQNSSNIFIIDSRISDKHGQLYTDFCGERIVFDWNASNVVHTPFIPYASSYFLYNYSGLQCGGGEVL